MEQLQSNSYFTNFGAVGLYNGVLTFCNINYQMIMQLGNFNYVGTLGQVNGILCTINNVYTSVQVPENNSGFYVGVLISIVQSENWSVSNITINNSYVYSKLMTGLTIAYINAGSFYSISIYSSIAQSIGSNYWALSGGLYGDSVVLHLQNTAQTTIINQCYFVNSSIFTNNSVIQASSGGLIGDSHENQIEIYNVYLKSIDLLSCGTAQLAQSSGLIAFLYDSIVHINNVQMSNIKLSSQNTNTAYVSGFIAQQTNMNPILNNQVYIFNSKVQAIQMYIPEGSPVYYGIIISKQPPVFNVNQLSSDGANTINGATIRNCGNIQNFNTQYGC
ncbi:Hypothetical_protein [Hexamita inflata]|uniref:Hypothetical_protein n=1 Tax=Hexamita inflata TaxID=28002 RepID=A0ABP1HRF8_9EUKA